MRIGILLLSVFLVSACKPQNQSTDSQVKGTKWQNCIFQQPEIKLWKKLFKSYLAKKFVERYMSCSKETLELTKQNMADLYAKPKGEYGDKLSKKMQEIRNRVTQTNSKVGPTPIAGKVLADALGGTLGNFWIRFEGLVTCTPYLGTAVQCDFEGSGSYSDHWDFNVAKQARSGDGGVSNTEEARVKIAREWMSGKPFQIISEPAKMRFVTSSIAGSGREIEIVGVTPQMDRSDLEYSDLGYCLIFKLKNAKSDGNLSPKEVFNLIKESIGQKCGYDQ